MLLENKNAIIYGGGGAIGGGVARTFAREGARVFLAGRTRESLSRESLSREKLASVNSNLEMDDAAYQGLLDSLDQMRMTHRSPRLAEIAATAAFLASDGAGAITGTFVNVTSGTFPANRGQGRRYKERNFL